MHFSTTLLPLFIAICLLFAQAQAHGHITCPNPRGAQAEFPCPKVPHAPKPDEFGRINIDYKLHFPAGDKNNVPGSGKRSQERAAGSAGYVPFTPLESGFRWRSGICGDEIGTSQDHMRGGEYYNDGVTVATYVEGGVIDVQMDIIAHHNGFMELHLCDVSKCGGEISASCFRSGHCTQLHRVPNPKCDSGNNKRCAPIDPNYPGRWYFPCSIHYYKSNAVDHYGGDGTILYKLPEGWSGGTYVLHWFWTSANTCNPPGVIDFFDSSNAPNWGGCLGQGGAIGGVARNQRACEGNVFPEEYFHCIDVKIEPGAAVDRSAPRVSPKPSPTMTPPAMAMPVPQPALKPSSTPSPSLEVPSHPVKASPTAAPAPSDSSGGEGSGSGDLGNVVLYADGAVARSINDGDVIDIASYKQIAIQVLTTADVKNVRFWIDGKLVWTEYHSPYFLGGNRDEIPHYWKNPPLNRKFNLKVVIGDSVDNMYITFVKNA